jgi:hypothetical protein
MLKIKTVENKPLLPELPKKIAKGPPKEWAKNIFRAA